MTHVPVFERRGLAGAAAFWGGAEGLVPPSDRGRGKRSTARARNLVQIPHH